MAAGGAVTAVARKTDQVVELIRARIADGTLKPGVLSPSGAELSKETGFCVVTCQKAQRLLFAEGDLTRLSQGGRYRVAGDGPPRDGHELAQALAGRRIAAGLMQTEFAAAIGMSVTTVGHAETGRLWQSRRFWEKADTVLGADGGLLALFETWQARSPSDATARAPVTLAAVSAPDVRSAPVEADMPDGIVITLPCDPVPVTVIWGDGSVTTMQPDPA